LSAELRREKLKELGATNPEGTSGIIPVNPPATYEPEVLEYRAVDTTPLRVKMRMKYIDPLIRRAMIAAEKGLIRTQWILRKTCTMYKDPVINFELIPIKVKNITCHVFSLKLSGDVVLRFTNKSKEGEEGTTVTWRWRACPTDPDAYSWHVVEGSADLAPSWSHSFVEDSTSTVLGRISKALDKVYRGSSVEVTGYWETGSLGDLLWNIVSILISGKITTRNGFDVTLKYYWLGKTQTISRHIDAKVVLPVEGNIRWSWD